MLLTRGVRVTDEGEDHDVPRGSSCLSGSAGPRGCGRAGTARRGLKYRNEAEAALEPEPPRRTGSAGVSSRCTRWRYEHLAAVSRAFAGHPGIEGDSLVGIGRAPGSLALVAGTGALLAMVANPFFGKMSDRTASPLGMRRPWMVIGLVGGSLGILIVALAPSIPVVLAGWCVAQLFFNALLAAMAAVLPDQVPSVQRGLVSGVLGVCMPVGSVCGTFVVKLFTGARSPCSWARARSADSSSSCSRSA